MDYLNFLQNLNQQSKAKQGTKQPRGKASTSSVQQANVQATVKPDQRNASHATKPFTTSSTHTHAPSHPHRRLKNGRPNADEPRAPIRRKPDTTTRPSKKLSQTPRQSSPSPSTSVRKRSSATNSPVAEPRKVRPRQTASTSPASTSRTLNDDFKDRLALAIPASIGRNTRWATVPGVEDWFTTLPPFASSKAVMKTNLQPYTEGFKWDESVTPQSSGDYTLGSMQFKTIELQYPGGRDAKEEFLLAVPSSAIKNPSARSSEYNPLHDIIATVETIIKFVVPKSYQEDFGNEAAGLLRQLIRATNRRLGLDFQVSIRRFNSMLTHVCEKRAFGEHLEQFQSGLPFDLVSHILYQTYSRTVAPIAESLTNYEAFSNQVYGEVNASLVHEFIRQTRLQHDQVFVDMGCGIGNVVLQIAAEVGCEAHGIEIMPQPSQLAMRQAVEFEARMQLYGLPHGSVELHTGDFLNHSAIHAQLRRAHVVLVNNYAFSSQLNQQLLQLFLDLEEGTQIISLKNFTPLDFKITSRNAGSPESILKVKQYPYWSDAVSWTSNGGHYFIHVVDRGPLRAFWASHA
ncbi:Nucleosomal histone H3-Lys79 methylase [Dispira parvispora]|uniref:Histone-lysine N-methyltransferase, H3 lysine-79 specific n=1 Tax=Dispira parvispora TaxID=1520584 RepID=A0A9W8ARK1_9FUNG|nr:Nucleosomal histone H3-Lys79 methylase [Dispira parvispora]